MSNLDISKEDMAEARDMEEYNGMEEPNGEEELVYAWCHIVFNNPEGDEPEKCVLNFRAKNNLTFNPLSYWGYCNDSKCEVLMYYSMWAKTPLDANISMLNSMDSPNSTLSFCENENIANWVQRVTISLKNAEGAAPGVPDGIFIKKAASHEKALEDFEDTAKTGLFVMRFG